jgi:flagellar motor switch protein FliN/FliY
MSADERPAVPTAEPAEASAAGHGPQPASATGESAAGVAAGDVEFLLSQAQAALSSVDAPRAPSVGDAVPFRLEEFGGAPASSETATLDLLRDVELDLKIELGRTQMLLEDVLRLRKGAVVPLDKLAGDPVDIFVNGRLIARGEVLVLNDSFCVRVAELVAAEASRGA